jgi:phage tail-like protein
MTVPGPEAPINATRFVVSLEGVELAFSELVEISSEIDPLTDTTTTAGAPAPTKQFGQTLPPKVTLRRGVDSNTYIWTWHMAAVEGDPAARKTCSLLLQDAAGQTLLTFVLENAWPSSVDITGPQPGQPILMETDAFTCDSIVMQPG